MQDDGKNSNERAVIKMFSRDKKLQAQVSHLDYMSCLDSPPHVRMILMFLRRQFQFEIQSYGEQHFERIITKDCNDRRLLFKLINGELTFDQFVVRIHCATRGVDYKCKDDLIRDYGVPERFFDPNLKKEHFMQQVRRRYGKPKKSLLADRKKSLFTTLIETKAGLLSPQ